MTTRILFVGNSFTARNSLPDLLAQLVEAGGKGALEWELVSAGGASLRQHFNKGDVAALLRDASWDAAVLQEQSTLPAKNAARMGDNVRDLDALIGQAGARTVLYMTWARADAPETQTAISAAYTESGEQVGATVVPAGLAWQLCLAQEPQIVLHDRDGSHPTLAGSYLAACAFYKVLFAGRAKKIPTLDIAVPEAEQLALQACAQQAVSAFRKGAF